MKCCCCIPIEIGVKLIGILTILSTIGQGIWLYTKPEWQSTMLPYVIGGAIMSLIWILAFVSDGEGTRKIAFLAYLCICLVGSMGLYAYQIYTGAITEKICTRENIDEMNHEIEHAVEDSGETLPDDYTGIDDENCTWGGKYYLMGDFALKLLLVIYFTYVISKWANNHEGYSKVH